MKRYALMLLAVLTLAASLGPLTSAFADPHKDRFRKDCSTTRKCT